jgi:hypothetical protein
VLIGASSADGVSSYFRSGRAEIFDSRRGPVDPKPHRFLTGCPKYTTILLKS